MARQRRDQLVANLRQRAQDAQQNQQGNVSQAEKFHYENLEAQYLCCAALVHEIGDAVDELVSASKPSKPAAPRRRQ